MPTLDLEDLSIPDIHNLPPDALPALSSSLFDGLKFDTSIISHCDGSSSLTISDNLKLICSINGPIESSLKLELPDKLALDISVNSSLSTTNNSNNQLIENNLRKLLIRKINLSMYPKQLLVINFQFLVSPSENSLFQKNSPPNTPSSSSSSSYLLELMACINAAYLALLDANISLTSSFNSVIINNNSSNHLICYDHNHLHTINNSTTDHDIIILYSESLGRFSQSTLFNILFNFGYKKSLLLNFHFASLYKSIIKQKFIYTDNK
ncbi:exosome non-catalytic core subunit RRP46 ASCRUDRAFT_8313 [Ascoidea rubescens DSM 1968]|uniref:Exoribonuclease phosphorolytic domain-containing protein n=1 Tax=Ascoidea rubescens DSM 1968 TaxID=1344418 RepID=A0A1D2VGC1_9ASCO|nr:hypothetical protein ASCRUDRAFT_8313 [Ascoidea rubescens DSM 1968]ODV60708.1 hypothetical protein ASCRUDRAFT_8313 [Ascoidea rubescens DSM 1968]